MEVNGKRVSRRESNDHVAKTMFTPRATNGGSTDEMRDEPFEKNDIDESYTRGILAFQ